MLIFGVLGVKRKRIVEIIGKICMCKGDGREVSEYIDVRF